MRPIGRALDLACTVLAEQGAEAVAGDTACVDAAWHEPGSKLVLGKRYAEGEAALPAVLHDLAHHPSTARFIATKLARHFVADDPPPALVDRLAHRFERSGGDLPSLYRELVAAPEAWTTPPVKLKTPEEFVVSTARMLRLGDEAFAREFAAGRKLSLDEATALSLST